MRGWAVLFATVVLSGCQVQWISPYSADLQKNATDMLADVVAWEGHMRHAAGTADADPRNPAVQASFDKWRGDIEAMSAIELGIDPGSAECDAVLKTLGAPLAGLIKTALPTAPAAASSGSKPVTHCESLPGIFTRMLKQVDDAGAGIPFILAQQCRLDWLPDDYFASPKPASQPAMPTQAQQDKAVSACKALFVAPPGTAHGNLIDPLVVELTAIIYREGRQSPPSGT